MIFSNKKIFYFFIIITPSFILNYFTLTIIDHDNNLSNFSTIIIFIFNMLNIIIGFIYYKYSFKVLIFFSIYCLIIFLFFDLISEKLFNKNSIIKESDSLGWVLSSNKQLSLKQQTLNGQKYLVNYKSSNIEGFREFGNLNSTKKKILVIGDSYTGGPYSSNDKMYYSIVKNNLLERDFDYEWFVMGAGGYGTAQQVIMLSEYFNKIKPDVILHQFCVNDFFDNSLEISKLSTSHNQYYRRPYIINDKTIKVETIFSHIYRFLFKYSFIFKKFDQIIAYKEFREHGRFKAEISDKLISDSVTITKKLINKMRKIIGEKTLFFSTNCADDKNNILSEYWVEMIENISGYPIATASDTVLNMKKNGEDVMHEDGGHLNDYGNMIYGKMISEEMIMRLENVKN